MDKTLFKHLERNDWDNIWQHFTMVHNAISAIHNWACILNLTEAATQLTRISLKIINNIYSPKGSTKVQCTVKSSQVPEINKLYYYYYYLTIYTARKESA